MQERKKCLLSFLGREKALGLDEIRMKSREKQVLLHKKQRDNRDSIEKRKQKAYKKVHEDPTFWRIRFSTQCGNFRIFVNTHILHEINVVDFRSAKFAISTHLKAMNFDFCKFFAHFEG